MAKETEKFVYSFSEGSKELVNVLGIKGANLAEMTNIGLPVPFGFTVTTEACDRFYEEDRRIADDIVAEIFEKLEDLENVTDKKFGDPKDPLLVSVRSGSVISMPGMMGTILNLGLNDKTVEGLAKLTEDSRFAYDCYRRFIQMFGNVVLGIPKIKFDAIFNAKKNAEGCSSDVDLTDEHLKTIVKKYMELVRKKTGREFPQDPKDQLIGAISAVFRSWNNERAVLYRKINDIPGALWTAVNVQAMVFGNKGNNSCTGVAFTRNPATGNEKMFGEFLINAQGEDVVAGTRTPQPISEMKKTFPKLYKQFLKIADLLEKHYKDMQDLEFTVEEDKLYMLQTRSGKRTAVAAVKIAVDMEKEDLIDKTVAVSRIEPAQIDRLLHPKFDPEAYAEAEVLTRGLPASPGAATGRIYFTAADAVKAAARGEKVLLVRQETSPEDFIGMVVAEGLLTSRGGMTSHAAVIARGMGRCCVAACSQMDLDEEKKTLAIGDEVWKEGDFLSLNGSEGTVLRGRVKTIDPEFSDDFEKIIEWADEIRTLKIRTNADNPTEAMQALKFGAEGIGLCRTEYMFFNEDRLPSVRRMLFAETEEERRAALEVLLPFQKSDFCGIYEMMGDWPVTIRLLDPPLNDFLPQNKEELALLSKQSDISCERLAKKAEELYEFNPMLGNRGCRLAVTYPEIIEMQIEAIITAAIEVKKKNNFDIVPEIMIPLVSVDREFIKVKETISKTAEKCFEKEGMQLEYKVGTMIEVPRACVTADKIAVEAEFFSFGTNDLTQMTYGLSRDDTGSLIREYEDKKIFDDDPFQTLDQEGVGALIEIAVEKGKQTRPNLKIGICGEHGGDPKTVEFCHNMGLDFISCSPFRVPAAKLAAAQAVLLDRKED